LLVVIATKSSDTVMTSVVDYDAASALLLYHVCVRCS